MGDDQVGVGIDRRLNVVADEAGAFAVGCHGAGIGIGQGDLPVRRLVQLVRNAFQTAHLLPNAGQLLLDPGDLRRVDPMRLLPVDPVHLREIPAGALLQMGDPELHLAGREVPVPVVHRLELAAVDGDAAAAENPDTAAEVDETRAGLPDRRAILLAEIGDRLVVRRKPSREPHHLDVAPRLPFQAPARCDAVEVAVDEELQKHGRMITWPPCSRGRRAPETGFPKIESIDECVDHANWIVASDPLLKTIRKERDLLTIDPLDKACHACP